MRSALEEVRLRVSKSTEATKKSHLGQFLTPGRTAAFMAGLFPPASGNVRLLDAGAGIGSLAGAFLERHVSEALPCNDIQVTAFELDDSLHADLKHGLLGNADRLPLRLEIIGGDFIEAAVNRVQFGPARFTQASGSVLVS